MPVETNIVQAQEPFNQHQLTIMHELSETLHGLCEHPFDQVTWMLDQHGLFLPPHRNPDLTRPGQQH